MSKIIFLLLTIILASLFLVQVIYDYTNRINENHNDEEIENE